MDRSLSRALSSVSPQSLQIPVASPGSIFAGWGVPGHAPVHPPAARDTVREGQVLKLAKPGTVSSALRGPVLRSEGTESGLMEGWRMQQLPGCFSVF